MEKKYQTLLLVIFSLFSFSSIAQNENTQTWSQNYESIKMGNYIYYISYDSLLRVDLQFEKKKVMTTGLNNPDQFTLVNDKFYFVNNKIKQDNDSVWTELWVCNGDDYDTYKIKSFKGVSILIPNGAFIYFAADDNLHGIELWISSGIEEGTRLIKDINEGRENGITYFEKNSTPVIYLNQVYFTALDKKHGRELWKTNGWDTGTELIKDLELGKANSDPNLLTVSGEYLYFAAKKYNAKEGNNNILYKTNGSATGTTMIKNFKGEKYSHLSHLIDVKGTLFFTLESSETRSTISNELWRTTGTSWTTEMVIEIDY